MLRFLRDRSEANKALLSSGEVCATFRRTAYDVTGQKPGPEEVMQVHVLFKGDKVRLDWEGLRGRLVRQWRTVLTNEQYMEWMVGNNAADIVDPDIGRGKISIQARVLPTRNLACTDTLLTNDDTFSSRKIARSSLGGRDLYVVEVVHKDSPHEMLRCYLDPAQGAWLVKYESWYDFGHGPVLVRQADVELQDAQNGAWCMKRYTSTIYREDRTIQNREELKVGDFDFKSDIPDRVFTWEGMGLPDGTTISDRRFDGVYYKYGQSAVDDKLILDAVNHPLVQETIAQAAPAPVPESREVTAAKPAEAVLAEEHSQPQGRHGHVILVVLVALIFLIGSVALWHVRSRRGGPEGVQR
jgi:hypothetical protein